MRARQYFLPFALIMMLSNGSLAQSPHYKMETFGTRNGLLSSKIYALAQTTDRRLWIGTELGVSVFDGYGFKNFQYTAENETAGRVLCITQDSMGGVWVGGDKGLFYSDGNGIGKVGLTNIQIAVEALLTDTRGNVWVGDLNALYKISNGLVDSVRRKLTGSLTLSPYAGFTKRVYGLAEDKENNIYVASFDGIFKMPVNTNSYSITWANPDIYKFVRSLAVISADSMYWNRLDAHPEQKINGKYSSGFADNYIGRDVFRRGSKIYALTTNGVGTLENGHVNHLISFRDITNNAVTALIDAEDNIWVGSWEGLLKFRRSPFQHFKLPPNSHTEIFSFLEKKNGDLLLGSNRGLIFRKTNAGIVPEKSFPSLFPNAEVMCLYEEDDGTVWAGSGYQGISRFKNNQLDNWRDTGFLLDNNCEALYPAGNGKLFACTENGVTIIDPKQRMPMVGHYPFQVKYTRKPELFGCYQTADSAYWFYGSQGLFRLQNEVLAEDSIQNMPVKKLYINKMISDKQGNTWIATQGKGLLLCRYEKNRLVLTRQYDSRDGVPSDNALSVLADKNGNIWWGDYMSLTILKNPGDKEQLITFNENDGLFYEYYQALKLEQQRNGSIWGITSMGAISFHPDSINQNFLPPSLHFNTITASGLAGNQVAISSPSFSYKQNSIQFRFTAVSLSDPGKIRYAYRLKEQDTAWTYTNNRIIDFNFLPPGRYTFEMIACNNNGIWTDTPLIYSFRIIPPFWQRWWFRALLLLAIAALVYTLFRRRVRDIRNKAAVKQQLAELEAKAIRAQMNPHFIFNSLNAIQECIVTEKVDAAYDYLSRFSKLLRLVLDNSDKSLIPLSSELEMIRLYLSLESLRFSQSFTHQISMDDPADTLREDKDDIYIPSLLIQPFVENAIWHGLVNKDGEKILLLQFTERDGKLQCVIEDNGVGRTRAAEIKHQKLGAEKFESKGTRLAFQRIALLNQQNPGSAIIDIVDLFDERQQPAGTRVIITLPSHLSNSTRRTHD